MSTEHTLDELLDRIPRQVALIEHIRTAVPQIDIDAGVVDADWINPGRRSVQTEYDLLADDINTAVEAGRAVTVNGQPVVYRGFGAPAHVHATGTLSVVVKARTKKGATNVLYFKLDAAAPVVVFSPAR